MTVTGLNVRRRPLAAALGVAALGAAGIAGCGGASDISGANGTAGKGGPNLSEVIARMMGQG